MTTPVVFLHGTRSNSQVWDKQMAELERHGVRCLAVDFPGHGTRTNERFTMSEALQAVDAAVRSCESKPLLVGLSLGGYTALQYAGEFPDRLAGVMAVACATPPQRPFVGAFRSIADALTRRFGWGGGTWNVVTDVLKEVMVLDPVRILRRTTLPVWLVSGSRDPMRFGAPLYRWANPRASYSVIRHAGHDANLHQPEAFNAGLLRALRELRAALPLLP